MAAMALDPALWGTLPKELLQLVFAHLPPIGIDRLRHLSKEWKRNVDSKDSEFSHVLDAIAYPKMIGLIFRGGFLHDIAGAAGAVCDVKANLLKYVLHDRLENMFPIDGDGGLICFVSETWPAYFVVVNPLTGKCMDLPPLLGMDAVQSIMHLKLVKLTMDRKTKEYQVLLLVSVENGDKMPFAQVYHSHIKSWTVVGSREGRVFGWGLAEEVPAWAAGDCRDRCVYNFGNGVLQQLKSLYPVRVRFGGVYVNDRLFVLHKETPPSWTQDGESVYCISEYHLPEKATAWVKLGVHSCDPCNQYADYRTEWSVLEWSLHACNGFLLLCFVADDLFEGAWLYELSTCEWRTLPAILVEPYKIQFMCEVSWSAVP